MCGVKGRKFIYLFIRRFKNVRMIINLQSILKCWQSKKTLLTVLPARWWRKPAGTGEIWNVITSLAPYAQIHLPSNLKCTKTTRNKSTARCGQVCSAWPSNRSKVCVQISHSYDHVHLLKTAQHPKAHCSKVGYGLQRSQAPERTLHSYRCRPVSLHGICNITRLITTSHINDTTRN